MLELGETLILIFVGIIVLLLIAKGAWPLIGMAVAAGFYFFLKGTVIADIAFILMIGFAFLMCAITITASEKNATERDKKG